MPPRDDRGQVATAVMMIVAIGLTAVVALGVVSLGQAADERSRAQIAADAAALGGAERIREELATTLLAGVRPDELWPAGCHGLGQDGASDFAARNGAGVTRYCWEPLADRIEVEVENRATGDPRTGVARARASADLGFGPATCTWDDADPAAPELRCGALVLVFEDEGDRLKLLEPEADDLPDLLEDALEPALVADRGEGGT